MVYISSSCLKTDKIIDVLVNLKKHGFNNVELSGGTKPYRELMEDLEFALKELNMNLVLHNYFPPPEVDFVLNLASLNDTISSQSLEHCKRAIDYSAQLNTLDFGFHAGFFMDIKVSEIGKTISAVELKDKTACFDQFCKSHEKLKKFAGNDIRLYVENNVFSKSNFTSFNGLNPLMLTDKGSYDELKSNLDFNLLLDVAHLKVSCKTLSRSFEEDLEDLFSISDYIHISDNDGLHDTNNPLLMKSELFQQLKRLNWTKKRVTLEIYDELNKVQESVNNFNLILNA